MYRNYGKVERIIAWIIENGENLVEEDRRYKEEVKKAETEKRIPRKECPLAHDLHILLQELDELSYLHGYRDCHQVSNLLREEE